MQYRFLGKTGLRVSEFCLGAMYFGKETDEADSHQFLNTFVEAGGNFIDTADLYGMGSSEEVLGRWLKMQKRRDLVVATKVRYPMGSGPNDAGLSRKHILDGIDDSLRRLQTDYIDLYQVHCWDPSTPLEETLSTLDTLVKSGKVRYIGASQHTGWQLQKAVDVAKHMGVESYVSMQPQYNLLTRATEWELIPVCLNEGLAVLPWSPLRGGWLSGKYRRGMSAPPEGSRVEAATTKGRGEAWDNYNNEATWRVVDALLETADETGKSPAQVALNWLLQRPGVTAPILGPRTLEQLEDSLGAVEWALTAEQMKKLNDASDNGIPSPYGEISRGQQRR
jgi:aryl-alcohol dehydrogenase-like predicted oxidoreductase